MKVMKVAEPKNPKPNSTHQKMKHLKAKKCYVWVDLQ